MNCPLNVTAYTNGLNSAFLNDFFKVNNGIYNNNTCK